MRPYNDMTCFEGLVCGLADILQGVVQVALVPFRRLSPAFGLNAARWVARRRMERNSDD